MQDKEKHVVWTARICLFAKNESDPDEKIICIFRKVFNLFTSDDTLPSSLEYDILLLLNERHKS